MFYTINHWYGIPAGMSLCLYSPPSFLKVFFFDKITASPYLTCICDCGCQLSSVDLDMNKFWVFSVLYVCFEGWPTLSIPKTTPSASSFGFGEPDQAALSRHLNSTKEMNFISLIHRIAQKQEKTTQMCNSFKKCYPKIKGQTNGINVEVFGLFNLNLA